MVSALQFCELYSFSEFITASIDKLIGNLMLNTTVFFSGFRRNPKYYFCLWVLLEQNATAGFLTGDERLHNTAYRAISSWSPDPIYPSSSDSGTVVSDQNFNWVKHPHCCWCQWRPNLQIITQLVAGVIGPHMAFEEENCPIRSGACQLT